MVAPSLSWSPRGVSCSSASPVLCVTSDLRRWEAWRLDRDELVLGRDPEADIVVETPSVSRFHVRLTFRAGEVEVEDLLSSNGSFVDGRRLSVFSLKEGDRFRVGTVHCMYTADPLRAVLPDGRRVAYLAQRSLTSRRMRVTPDSPTTLFSPGTTTLKREHLEHLLAREETWTAGKLMAERSGQQWRLGSKLHRFGWRTEIPVDGWAYGGWTGRGHGAEVEWTGGAHRIRPTAMFASVSVNDRAVKRARLLRHGDRVTVADRAFRYLSR